VPTPTVAQRSRAERAAARGPRASSAVGRGSSRSSTTQLVTAGAPAPKSNYDVVLVGKVYTGVGASGGSSSGSGSGAVGVAADSCVAFCRANGHIAFVGQRQELLRCTDEGQLKRAAWCRTFEVEGLIMPAFHDAHCHPFGAGNRNRNYNDEAAKAEDERLRASSVDLSGCNCWDDVKTRLTAALAAESTASAVAAASTSTAPKAQPLPPLVAEGCSTSALTDMREKAATSLEALAPGRAIVVVCGQSYLLEAVAVSESALKALPTLFESWTYANEDARIERLRSGKPSGFFTGAVWAARFALLSPASITSQGLRGLIDGLRVLPQHGIVACTDAFVFEERIACYELAFAQDARRQLPRTSLAIGFRDDMPAKRIAEIVARAPTMRRAWQATDFRYCVREGKVEVDHGRGDISWDSKKLASVVHGMLQADFSMHMHVFYSAATHHSVELLLEAEQEQRKRQKSRGSASTTGDRRHKLAHAFEISAEDAASLCKTPLIAVCYQPYWFKTEYSYDDTAVGTHAELLRGGARVCYGSDWDITELSPIMGIREVVRREGTFHDGKQEQAWEACLAQAVRMYTLEAARAHWLDETSGTLETGKFADVCILDKDLFSMPKSEFCAGNDHRDPAPVRVSATFMRGVCIFRDETPPDAPPALARLYSQASQARAAQQSQGASDMDFLCSTCSCESLGFCGSFQQCC